MCGPSNSSLWNSDYKFLTKIGLVNQANGLYADTGFDGYQLSDDDIDKLILHIKNVKGKIYLELKGGEPLIMPQTKTLVNRLIELPNAEKITLLIVTNGTVVPEWVDSVQHKISKLQLIVSVDGIGEVYNYIRGTNKFTFNDCFKNIEKFHAFKNIDLKFNVVVQNLNIHQMIEIHQLLTAFPKTTINYITLSMPSYLAVNVMPSTARDKIYENFLKNSSVFKNYETQMQHIYKLLLIEPLPETLEYFKKITVALDKKRKQDASAVLPHLFNR
jgi:sulfatase maturation enzyme AslB (radical SAM superfamily)